MCGFIAQLVEQGTGNAEVTGSNPVEALIFFRFVLSNCLNRKIYCDDHSSLSSTTAVQKWIISYIILHNKWMLPALHCIYSAFIRASDRSRKKVKFCWIFRDKIAEKLANFAGIFGANLAGKLSVKKQQILWLFSGQISLEIDRFCADQTSVFNVFLTEVIICSFNNNTLQKWNNSKAFNIMASAQFFATYSIPGSLHVSVTKFWRKFAILQQVNCNTPSSWDRFQNCCTDMYLIRCLGNFAVFCVFLWILQDFADLPEFHGSATVRNIRSPDLLWLSTQILRLPHAWVSVTFGVHFMGLPGLQGVRTLKLFFCFVLTSLFSFFHFTCDLNKFLH